MTPVQPSLRAKLLVVGILALAAVFVTLKPLSRNRVPADEVAVALVLPDQVLEWVGDELFYCQNESCLRAFQGRELNGRRTCPECGGTLDAWALGEHNQLPADTTLIRKCYRDPRGHEITVAIVLSGKDQKSIHRPQQCLPAQGFAIEESGILPVPLPGRKPLELTLLTAREGRRQHRLFLAYWFIGGQRETASHWERMAWMAWDKLVHGTRSRWAYVSILAGDTPPGESVPDRLAAFTRILYPMIRRQ